MKQLSDLIAAALKILTVVPFLWVFLNSTSVVPNWLLVICGLAFPLQLVIVYLWYQSAKRPGLSRYVYHGVPFRWKWVGSIWRGDFKIERFHPYCPLCEGVLKFNGADNVSRPAYYTCETHLQVKIRVPDNDPHNFEVHAFERVEVLTESKGWKEYSRRSIGWPIEGWDKTQLGS